MLTPSGFTQTEQKHRVANGQQPQLMPHDLDAEAALLGALLIDPSQMIEVGYLQPGDFFILNHGLLYKTLVTLFDRHGDYDYITVIDALESGGYLVDFGGPGGVTDLINVTPTSYGAPYYAEIIYRHSVSRQVIIRCTDIVQAAHVSDTGRGGDVLVNEAIKTLSDIDATRHMTAGAQHISQASESFLDKMEAVQAGKLAGLKTGIRDLDSLFGGFQARKIYVLAGRPGMGKSGLALQIAHNLGRQGKRVLFFSLEMDKEDLVARMVSQETEIPYEKYNNGGNAEVTNDEWLKIIASAQKVAKLPVIIDDTPALTVSSIRSIAQKEIVKEPVDLIIIDHLDIAKSSIRGDNLVAQASQIANDTMAMPKQLGCAVLALKQLSREPEKGHDHRPKMHHLRNSGNWEQNADGILFLYRDEVYNPDTEFPNIAEVIAGKNRGGKTGIASVYHDKTTSRFIDLEMRTVAL